MLHSCGTGRLLRSASLALVACLALAAPALAGHEPPRLGLSPIGQSGQFFSLSLEPGESRRLQVEVANFDHDELRARTYAADGYSIINGGFAAELFGEPASGTTRWLAYTSQEVTLGPGEGLVIDFSVSVPADAEPGAYITALVAENVEPYRGADGGGVALEQVNRTVVAVAIDVPGPRRPALEIGAVGHKAAADTSFVSFEVANTGNVHLKPAGQFSLRAADGVQIASAEPAMDSLYAGTEALVEMPLAETLAPGDYCAELSLADAETGVSAATECLAFTVAAPVALADGGAESGSQTIPIQPAVDAASADPLLAGLAALGGLTALAGLYLALRRRRRRLRARAEPPWPPADGPDPGAGAGDKVSQGTAETGLLRAIRAVREVHRAWLIRHDAYLELAFEATPGTGLAVGSGIARSLQASIGDAMGGVPLRVVFLGGPGIVARHTGGSVPLYARGDVDQAG